jgi:hypothetical protein
VPIAFTFKQHDTRPKIAFGLLETNQTTGVLQPVDLTAASSARFCAKDAAGAIAFTSSLAFSTPRTAGIVIYTPVAFDTAAIDTYRGEVEVTWSDGGVETYPNDGYFTMTVIADLC